MGESDWYEAMDMRSERAEAILRLMEPDSLAVRLKHRRDGLRIEVGLLVREERLLTDALTRLHTGEAPEVVEARLRSQLERAGR